MDQYFIINTDNWGNQTEKMIHTTHALYLKTSKVKQQSY